MNVKRNFGLIAAGILLYCLAKLGLCYEPGKFGHSVPAFLVELLYGYVPMLLLLLSCYVLFYAPIKRTEVRVLLFILFYFFPARRVVMGDNDRSGILSLQAYFDYWTYASMDFRLEYLVLFVIASLFFIVFLIKQIQLWPKR